ncbi:hypothetical protein AURDEDRAFT_184773 [Auricularia subglabra TFB-10046 SS5]|nr:hypothetical protein AURDEDRAFT_184773 [Auricularia subglabra TFB-10046 SS5]
MLLIPSILALAAGAGAAQTWYALQWNAPSFTSISGQLTVPRRPGGAGAVGTPYVWPGVQNSNGVLQAVLDGKNNGNWWIGNGWYGNPSLPWGAGFSVSPGQVVNFSLKSNGNGTWTGTLSGAGSAQTTAVLAVEVYNNPIPPPHSNSSRPEVLTRSPAPPAVRGVNTSISSLPTLARCQPATSNRRRCSARSRRRDGCRCVTCASRRGLGLGHAAVTANAHAARTMCSDRAAG